MAAVSAVVNTASSVTTACDGARGMTGAVFRRQRGVSVVTRRRRGAPAAVTMSQNKKEDGGSGWSTRTTSSTPSTTSFAHSCPPEVVRPDGWIAVLGIGSLLSERSARFTSPNLRNFRTARLKGWRRVFAHAAPVFFERGIASPETREISSLSMEPVVIRSGGGGIGNEGEGEASTAAKESEAAHGPDGLLATYFEIPGDEFPALAAREAEFELTPAVAVADDASRQPLGAAILCTKSSDAEYISRHCTADRDGGGEGSAACGCVACTLRSFGEEKIWFPRLDGEDGSTSTCWNGGGERGGGAGEGEGGRDNNPGISILPCRVYLRHCVLAARSLGAAAEASFLDYTFLSDRITTLRQYLDDNLSVLEEEPPPSLVDRYSG